MTGHVKEKEMTIQTKLFGEIEVDEEKMITFSSGIIGFPDMKDFLLIHDSESTGSIKWLQSIQEPAFAMPVIDPLIVQPEYNPEIEDELLKPLGIVDETNILVLVTITIPHEVEKMTVNLCGPIIVSADTRKASQIIVESDKYPVKFPVYDILKKLKEGAGE